MNKSELRELSSGSRFQLQRCLEKRGLEANQALILLKGRIEVPAYGAKWGEKREKDKYYI
ncbi:MAG: hypothetical protein ACI934_001897 [Pseudohongiellaceae bacterium]